MQSILTFKIPSALLHQLESASKNRGLSKGALVRTALEDYFKRGNLGPAVIERITCLLASNKKTKIKADWKKLREKSSASKPDLSPEEEVLNARLRRQ